MGGVHSPFLLLSSPPPPLELDRANVEQRRLPRERLYFFLALFLFSSFSFFLESLGLLALR